MEGFLLINKPAGITSHDCVDRVRKISGVKRVGHAGTLDPFATGLLIIGVGREATREFSKFSGLDKAYRAIFRFGAWSDTDDRDGTITPGHNRTVDEKEFRAALAKFTGAINQIPPRYSAKKIKGKKMYELARSGAEFERAPVPVHIYSIDIERFSWPDVSLCIHCSSGTYIRAIARDIGEALGVGGYAEALERTSIGTFSLKEAAALVELNQNNWQDAILPTEIALQRVLA